MKHFPTCVALGFLASGFAIAADPKVPLGKLPAEEKAKRVAELNAMIPTLEAEYVAFRDKAAAELEVARSQYDADKDAAKYQAAIDKYNRAITAQAPLAEISRVLIDLRELHHEYNEEGKWKRPVSEKCQRVRLAGYHWIEKNVWEKRAQPVIPYAIIDRSYLKKATIKIAMCGDSLTEYMDPAATMLDHLDPRFQVLDCGLSGHTLSNWFTDRSSNAVRDWQPDIIVVMLGTNGTTSAMQEETKGSKPQNRDTLAKQFAADLAALRNLPSKPQVIVVSVPAQGPGLWYQGVPAMWELQSRVAREGKYPFIDMSAAMNGLLSDIPNAFSHFPNRKSVGKWQHSFDDAHASYGPAMAKYYGLVQRQILEPERWYNLNVKCSATDDAFWKEPWLIAQAYREPGESPERAAGIQQKKTETGFEYGPHPNTIARPKANGEVSFIRPQTGGDFTLLQKRKHMLTFGRPYQIKSDTPPTNRTFTENFAVTGTLTRGDGATAVGVKVSLGGKELVTDKDGMFSFSDLKGNIVELPMVVNLD